MCSIFVYVCMYVLFVFVESGSGHQDQVYERQHYRYVCRA